jgi:uncharacterized protein YlxP (DUF503 family)
VDGIWIGVLRLELIVPGARTLKDRRQGVLSVRDRLRRRFDVTVNEVQSTDDPQRQPIVCTTAGNDQRSIRTILDRCVGAVREHATVVLGRVDVDVFRWDPSGDDWAARMMAELGSHGDEDG